MSTAKENILALYRENKPITKAGVYVLGVAIAALSWWAGDIKVNKDTAKSLNEVETVWDECKDFGGEMMEKFHDWVEENVAKNAKPARDTAKAKTPSP